MSALDVLVQTIMADRNYEGQIVHTRYLPAREPRYRTLARPIKRPLARALHALGIRRLYTHQARAIDIARDGKHVVVATGTASGKTLCYNIPVLDTWLRDQKSRALYLFPTKALAQDQIRSLEALCATPGLESVRFATYDGDTPKADRGRIRRRSHIVFTNPDMLHIGILPNHAAWAHFLANVRYVVIDEAHYYRGVLGSHVANILRRLWRLCDFYGSQPTVIAASATIANPGEHLERLIGMPVQVVNEDGGPRGQRIFLLWNPPCVDRACLARRSANTEAANLLTMLMQNDLRTIVFTRSRRAAELILRYARFRLAHHAPELSDRVAAYRAGYLAEQRRQIEKALFDEELLGVTATNALELGIDIGGLDAVVTVGFPGTIASLWQQVGRAGRGAKESLAVLIAQENPLDQYLMNHPEAIFDRPVEQALIDPENEYILRDHLLCAAYERPLDESDRDRFGEAFDQMVTILEGLGHLQERHGRLFYAGHDDYPAQHVNIRSLGGDPYLLLLRTHGGDTITLETLEPALVFERAHPGAVYLHQGESYLVEEIDMEHRRIWLTDDDGDYYTRPRLETDFRLERVWEQKQLGPATVFLGELTVVQQVVGYRRHKLFTDEVLSDHDLRLPPTEFRTVGVWWTVPRTWAPEMARLGLDFAGGLHATEHTAIGLLPLFAMCDRWDIGGVSTPMHPDTGTPLICIYDGHPGGVGIAERGYEQIETLWHATLDHLRRCPCEEGCPACIQSPKCGNNNLTLDKHAARWLLRRLLASVSH